MEHETSHSRLQRNDIHLYAALVRDGHEPEPDEIGDLRMIRAWADAILNGESLDVADVYYKAFGKDAA